MSTYCPSSSSSSPASWDVFLSFYGKDTRRNLVANLYFALDQAGISTFRDDPALEKGQEISSGLLNAIKDTNMFVVVVSENYALSSWCLNELVEILASKKSKNHVIPVFYYVDPSDLRHQKGSFGEALESHKKHYSVDVIGKWKSALTEIAELSGYHLKKDANENESDTVQAIVEHVTSQTSTKVDLDEYLVGIDDVVEEIYHKLRMESTNVRAIGICGMGGIGKTTAAKAFYNKYSDKFDISCLVENVNQYLQEGNPLLSLLQQLLSDFLRRKNYRVFDVKSGVRQLQHILYSKEALIILDGLDQPGHLGWLSRLCKLFSSGTRIVITTRDVYLLKQLKVDISEVDIYMVKILEQLDSLKLFSYHAFRKPMPPENFGELSISFVTYAGGLPLALKVLGASLCGRPDKSFWKAKLKKVREIPEKEILKILQMSYDDLDDETEKAIFLDIVFFFIGKDKDEVVHVFRSCDFFPEVGIPILMDRCLLTIDQNNKFQMHNLIQDMGREVIREESKHGNCIHMYLCEENECHTLQNIKGSNKIEGLVLDLSSWTKKYTSTKLFERMPNLRLLEVIGAHDITGNFENSFHELRCIRWHHCPWTCLPSSFRPQKLIVLDMPFNQFEMLWHTSKLLLSLKMINMSYSNLKIINLSYSKQLKKTPDIRDFAMVEKLCFRGCKNLQKLQPSFGQLKYLKDLDIGECGNLKELPETIGQLSKLGQFDLRGCVNLKRLPQQIKQLSDLSSLNLQYCMNLVQLPEQLGDMRGLRMIDASYTAIEQLPDSIGQLISLTFLNLSYCKRLTSLPDSLWKLKLLKELYIAFCSKLKRLPEKLGEMLSVELIYASNTAIQEIPDSIGRLNRLKVLDFGHSKKLKDVLNSISNLTSLVSLYLEDIFRSNLLPDALKNMNKLESLSLGCNIRLWLPMILSLTSLEQLSLYGKGTSLSSVKWLMNLSKLSNLATLTLDNWGSSYLELPPSLTYLHLSNNATVEQLPDLSNLEHLKTLHIKNCIGLQSLPSLPLNLVYLSVDECTYLKDVPDLSILTKLERLRIHDCSNLESIDLRQRCLEVKRLPDVLSFSANMPNKKIPEWFDFKSNGSNISFNISSSSVLGAKYLGIALWVVYKYKKHSYSPFGWIDAAITNKTEGIIEDCVIDVFVGEHEEVQVESKIECISRHKISIKSGDRIEVEFRISDPGKVLMCGAHIIPETTSSTSSVSIN